MNRTLLLAAPGPHATVAAHEHRSATTGSPTGVAPHGDDPVERWSTA